jgi:asparagine synthase (glutamine-hydrolysing)
MGAETVRFVRDTFGLSTLYYAVVDDCKVFSTNTKDIVGLFPNLRKINNSAIGEYLTFNHIAGTKTIFADIKQIEPGTAILVSSSGLRTYEEWRPSFRPANVSVQEGITQIQNGLRQIIESEFAPGDGNAALLLSGGIDSSLVCDYLAKKAANLATFSVSIPDYERTDEPYFLQVSKRYRTQQTTVAVGNDLYARNLLKALWHMEEPLLLSNSVPLMLVCEMAKTRGYDLLITGEGCDGLFSGGLELITRLKMSDNPDITDQMFKDIVLSYSGTGYDLIQSILADSYDVDIGERYRILAEEVDRNGTDNVREILNGFHVRTYTERLARRMFRMSAASSVTCISPFLTKSFARLLFAIPHEVRNHNGISKYPLVELSSRVFGEAFSYRPKVGFNIPIGRWFRGKEGLGIFKNVLLDERTIGREFYKSGVLKDALLSRITDENAPLDYLLWGVLNLELWIRMFVEGEGEAGT